MSCVHEQRGGRKMRPPRKTTGSAMQKKQSDWGARNTGKPKKLLDQARDIMRRKHYSPRTEKSYLAWMKRYIIFHYKRHPRDMGVPEIETFLTALR